MTKPRENYPDQSEIVTKLREYLSNLSHIK